MLPISILKMPNPQIKIGSIKIIINTEKLNECVPKDATKSNILQYNSN